MRRAFFAVFFVLTILTTGCSILNDAQSIFDSEKTEKKVDFEVTEGDPESIEASLTKSDSFVLLIESPNVPLAKYEPSRDDGVYIGASVLSDKRIQGNLVNFDKLMGKEHAIYVYYTTLDDEYPLSWVLECVANLKTPCIVLNPGSNRNPYEEEKLVEWAKAAGELNIPIFIQFFPYSSERGYKAEAYKKFFKKAYQAFLDYAPNAAIVWSIDSENSANASFYPGDSFCDWVGLNINAKIEKDGSYADFTRNLDTFYFQYQNKKPIMLSELAFSHFTTYDNKYYTALCAETIPEVYNLILNYYPRIKAVIYNDYNGIDPKLPWPGNQNNFQITSEDALVTAYRQVAEDRRFISFTAESSGQDIQESRGLSAELMKSQFKAVLMDGVFYITEKSLLAHGNFSQELLKRPGVIISGEKSHTMQTLREISGADFYVDMDLRVLYLSFR